MSRPIVPPADAAALAQIFYVSRCRADPDEVQAILVQARSYNARCHVTGMLLFSGGHFAQLLEGPGTTIAELMAVIERDPRHDGVTRLLQRPAAQRLHAAWSMGYTESLGVDDLLQVLVCPQQPIEPARAERLLLQLFGAVDPRLT